jgi:Rrf2 family transcriptional regulator, nitric oxide-sensitive transcriptional repressor
MPLQNANDDPRDNYDALRDRILKIMRLKAFTDYSLRVLIFLAARPQRRATIAEIAAAFDISETHLMKVCRALGKAGVLANVRGKGGGLELAREPEAISVGHVVRVTEGSPRLAECFERANGCRIASVCKLRTVLDDAAQAFYAVLDRYSLEDIARYHIVLSRMLTLPRLTRLRRS